MRENYKGQRFLHFLIMTRIYGPFYEKRSLFAFPISVDPDQPAHTNDQFWVLNVF